MLASKEATVAAGSYFGGMNSVESAPLVSTTMSRIAQQDGRAPASETVEIEPDPERDAQGERGQADRTHRPPRQERQVPRRCGRRRHRPQPSKAAEVSEQMLASKSARSRSPLTTAPISVEEPMWNSRPPSE